MSLTKKIQKIELNHYSFVRVEGYNILEEENERNNDSDNIIRKEVYKVLNGSQNGLERTFDVEFTIRNKEPKPLSKEEKGKAYLKMKEDLAKKRNDESLNFEYFVAMTTGAHSKVYRNGKRMPGVKEIKHPKVLELLRTLPETIQDWIEDLK